MPLDTTTSVDTSAPARPVPAAPLRWTVHPAARRPAQAAVVGAVLVVFAALATSVGGPFLGLLSAVVLSVSLRSYFLPRTFELDDDGAREHGPLHRERALPWDAVRRVVGDRHGLYLSTLFAGSRWVRDRGLLLRTAGNRGEVDAYVRAHAEVAEIR